MLLSSLDSDRFRLKIGKASFSKLDALQATLSACLDEDLDLLIARCPSDEISVIHAMEEVGFRWMDTLVYLGRPISEKDTKKVADVRLAQPQDAAAVVAVARSAFKSYAGHYHADLRLDRNSVRDIYPDWAWRAMAVPGVADCVLVAEDGGQ